MATSVKAALRRTHAERTDLSDRRMLEAAIALIIERGTDKTTLKDVGEQAGYSRGLAGYRFGSKAGLFEFIVRSVSEQWLAELKSATSGRHGLDALCAAIDEHCRFCIEASDAVRAFYILWFESIGVQSPVREVINGIHDRRLKDVVAWIERSDYAGATGAEAIAGQFNAAVLGIAYQWLAHPDKPDTIRALHDTLKHTMTLYFAEPAHGRKPS